MSEESLQRQLKLARRRLAIREEQFAAKGRLNADPEIIIDIEETQVLIAALQIRLNQTNSNPPPTPIDIPAPNPVREPKVEQEKIFREIDESNTSHQRRLEIGDYLSKLGDSRPGVGLREDGLPDIAWLPVAPGGQITLENETFTVAPFYIAKYLVTFAQYEAFVRAADGFNNPKWWRGMPQNYQSQRLGEQRTKSWNNPRDTISWYQSVAFGRWLNSRLQGLQFPATRNPSGTTLIIGQNAQVRLPTEWEWQWAAQGGNQQREYSWGDWQDGYANTRESGLGRAVAVGMYPQGMADCGALDMLGELWEWCANDYDSLKTVDAANVQTKGLRGGSFVDVGGVTCTFRGYYNPGSVRNRVGMRVVVSTPIAGL